MDVRIGFIIFQNSREQFQILSVEAAKLSLLADSERYQAKLHVTMIVGSLSTVALSLEQTACSTAKTHMGHTTPHQTLPQSPWPLISKSLADSKNLTNTTGPIGR